MLLYGWFVTECTTEALIAVFVCVSGLLPHRIIRADLPIAGIPYSHSKTALRILTRIVLPSLGLCAV